MHIVKVTTRGHEVFDSENGPTVGYDGIEVLGIIVPDNQDLNEIVLSFGEDPENYANIEIIEVDRLVNLDSIRR